MSAFIYQFVEPQDGCIVPRRGDYRRSAAILATAASWYGAEFIPTDPGALLNLTYVVPTPERLAELREETRRIVQMLNTKRRDLGD